MITYTDLAKRLFEHDVKNGLSDFKEWNQVGRREIAAYKLEAKLYLNENMDIEDIPEDVRILMGREG